MAIKYVFKKTLTLYLGCLINQIFRRKALDTRANQMKPQRAVSYPDKIDRHQFGGGCQVMMAERGEKNDENVDDALQAQVLCKICQPQPD